MARWLATGPTAIGETPTTGDVERMLVRHPSGQRLSLDIDPTGLLPGVWAVFYTEADCTGTAYDISYWNEPPNLLVLTGNHTLMHAGQFSVVRRLLNKPVLF